MLIYIDKPYQEDTYDVLYMFSWLGYEFMILSGKKKFCCWPKTD